MISKSLALFLLGVAAATAAYGQQTLNLPQRDDTPKAFAWSFDGDGGYIGVQTQEVTRDNFAKFGLSGVRGVAVEKVMEKSPAESAGIRAGDVIVKFNGDEVTSVRKLTRLIGEVDPDHQATLTVLRGGREQNVTVTVGKRPANELSNGNFEFNMPQMGNMKLPDLKNLPQMQNMPDFQNMPDLQNMPNGQGWSWSSVQGGRQIGAGITPLTKQLADYFRVDSGVLVTEVRENSPAAKAGLRAGDIILKAAGRTIMNRTDLVRAINDKKDGEVQLMIDRGGSRQTLSVTPDAAKGGNSIFQDDNDNID